MKTRWYGIARKITPLFFGGLLFFGILYQNYIMIMALMASSLLFGAFHCGWICPFGYLQEMLGLLGRKLRLPLITVPGKIDRFLRFFRYILMALSFLGLGIVYFLNTPFTATMGFLSGSAGAVTGGIGALWGSFLVLSLFTERAFCRYICAEGARHGILSMARIVTIKRDGDSCIDCGACDRACPMGITVSAVKQVRNGQCINCFECLQACPMNKKSKTLSYGWAFGKPPKKLNESPAKPEGE
ncbi:MAG: 4Fe-4S binding protein [Spirochaetales bacterium]|nr:4Fe-4S binding protein [Spirochaetales bacterium]